MILSSSLQVTLQTAKCNPHEQATAADEVSQSVKVLVNQKSSLADGPKASFHYAI